MREDRKTRFRRSRAIDLLPPPLRVRSRTSRAVSVLEIFRSKKVSFRQAALSWKAEGRTLNTGNNNVAWERRASSDGDTFVTH